MKADLLIANQKLIHFCRKVESLYGKTVVTPNMHPSYKGVCGESVYIFWLFGFERYNGLLGSFHTNNREVEAQLNRPFLTTGALDDLQYSAMPLDFQDFFHPLCSKARQTNLAEGVVENKSLLLPKAMSGP